VSIPDTITGIAPEIMASTEEPTGYDAVAPRYNEMHSSRLACAEDALVVDTLARVDLPTIAERQGARMLDLGCGTGHALTLTRRSGIEIDRYFGIDSSKSMLAQFTGGRPVIPSDRWFVGYKYGVPYSLSHEAMPCELAEGVADISLVTALWCLNYLDDQEITRQFRSVRDRCLSGTIVIVASCMERHLSSKDYTCYGVPGAPPKKSFGHDVLCSIRGAGFKQVSAKMVTGPVCRALRGYQYGRALSVDRSLFSDDLFRHIVAEFVSP